jgi:hypothetical protein
MKAFRALLVFTLAVRVIAVSGATYLHSMFSEDTLELMRYAGHGARINVQHPALWLLYLLPFPAYLLMIFRRKLGRILFSTYLALLLLSTFFFGVSISGPPETFISLLAVLLDGMILGLAFISLDSASYWTDDHIEAPKKAE